MNLIRLLKDGQEYMQICPKDVHFKEAFPEINVIQLTRLGIRFTPPFAILLFVWQYYMDAPLIASIVTILFALSLPIQGILWLGKRAHLPLPLTLLAWFNELKQKLIENRIIGEKASLRPTYMELVKLLRLCQNQLGYYGYEKYYLTPEAKKHIAIQKEKPPKKAKRDKKCK